MKFLSPLFLILCCNRDFCFNFCQLKNQIWIINVPLHFKINLIPQTCSNILFSNTRWFFCSSWLNNHRQNAKREGFVFKTQTFRKKKYFFCPWLCKKIWIRLSIFVNQTFNEHLRNSEMNFLWRKLIMDY